ncbi:hypothetical protein [Sandarakinorhabdus oryzae]|uniref:hypothetical protein n=1 Tax=Sandarakinorhabdus oryzae TaxID=2675220 RepID=UPI0012E2430E|nr:hypothetical protein [Sandarakinorhabdus oryzae]
MVETYFAVLDFALVIALLGSGYEEFALSSFTMAGIIAATASSMWCYRRMMPYWRTIAGLAFAHLTVLVVKPDAVMALLYLGKGASYSAALLDGFACYAIMLAVFYAKHRAFPWNMPEP